MDFPRVLEWDFSQGNGRCLCQIGEYILSVPTDGTGEHFWRLYRGEEKISEYPGTGSLEEMQAGVITEARRCTGLRDPMILECLDSLETGKERVSWAMKPNLSPLEQAVLDLQQAEKERKLQEDANREAFFRQEAYRAESRAIQEADAYYHSAAGGGVPRYPEETGYYLPGGRYVGPRREYLKTAR